MLTPDMKLISVDDHVYEHPTVWSSRLPQRYREQGPRIVERSDGSECWSIEGILVDYMDINSELASSQGASNAGLALAAGLDFSERSFEPRRYDQMLPGIYDPVARLADMDKDGVWAQTCFPSFARFAGTRFLPLKDKKLALMCVQAYNDFIVEEWCAAAPERYIPLTILPLWNVDACVKEIERNADRGVHAISFPETMFPLGLPSIFTGHWNRVLAAAAASDQVICMHFGSSGMTPAVSPEAPQAVITALFGASLFASMAEWVLSSVFHDHPRLKVAYSEGGIGWWPFALMRLDQVWDHYRFYDLEKGINQTVRPSDIIRDHVYGCFIDDPVGIEMRDVIGVDNIMWESDYPHADSLFPKSRTNAERVFAAVPDADVKRIVETNARSLFRFGL